MEIPSLDPIPSPLALWSHTGIYLSDNSFFSLISLKKVLLSSSKSISSSGQLTRVITDVPPLYNSNFLLGFPPAFSIASFNLPESYKWDKSDTVNPFSSLTDNSNLSFNASNISTFS